MILPDNMAQLAGQTTTPDRKPFDAVKTKPANGGTETQLNRRRVAVGRRGS